MATIYVIHAEGDTPFVRQRVLRALPSNGYDCWLASHHFAGAVPGSYALAPVMDRCQSVLIVLSPALTESAASMEEIGAAIACRHTPIVVQVETLGEQDSTRLPEKLWAVPKVDFTLEGEDEVDRLLAGLLPPAGFEPEADAPKEAERIEWDAQIFSDALAAATAWHDHARAASLVEALLGHLANRPDKYPPDRAFEDLKKLRQEREFVLMRRYAEGVIASGTRTDEILSQYGQALIETGDYERALGVLQSIIDDSDSSQFQIYEARGLIGRVYKQRCMDAPGAEGSASLLRRAVKAYETAYQEDHQNFWHGVNAASCMLRAERDGTPVAATGRAQEIARQILADLNELEQAGPLKVWDCASKVEALLALGRYDEAERAVDVYINHPKMHAFEVSSTFRQFDQVLQLGRDPRGRAILARLGNAVERYRAGRVASRTLSEASEPAAEPPLMKPLLIRLGDPDWEPKGVDGLVVQSRLGKILTARGSEAHVRKLLADSTVISVEESRPAGLIECVRSLPFINAAMQSEPNPAVTYTERGDRALIAVIDDGIDVLHEAFLDAEGRSRIVGIWDQNSPEGDPPAGLSYGTFHDAEAIARYVQCGAVPLSLGRNNLGHGTHVASIAAGRAVGNFAGGVAPGAKLLVVVSGGGGPNGYFTSHHEALVFIDKFATEQNMPVVVNVSQGMNAGAHDGKSSLEASFDAFSRSGTRPGRVVVKSAGNERSKNGHAYVTLGSDGLERLRWRRHSGADDTERIELWWSSADELEFRLGEPVKPVDPPRKPDAPADWSRWVGTAAPVLEGVFQKGGQYRLAFTKLHVDNGDSLLEIELGNDTTPAGLGEWLLEIRSGKLLKRCEVHCWIERSQGLPTEFKSHANDDMTLSIPGTAQSVITVGAVDACRPLVVGDFSSYGPTRNKQNQPLVCAPGVDVNAARAGTCNDVILKSGTSMAAPHVTGAVALLLSKTAKAGKSLGANQVAAVLRQKAQDYNGDWDRGRGYGVIDVTALLAAFD